MLQVSFAVTNGHLHPCVGSLRLEDEHLQQDDIVKMSTRGKCRAFCTDIDNNEHLVVGSWRSSQPLNSRQVMLAHKEVAK